MHTKYVWIGLVVVGTFTGVGAGLGLVAWDQSKPLKLSNPNSARSSSASPIAGLGASPNVGAPTVGTSQASSPDGQTMAGPDINPVTQKFPKVGQCFMTAVTDTGGRLEGDLASGTTVFYADGHAMVDYEQRLDVQKWRRGDRVKLCVTDIPRDCPKDDHRGVGYAVINLRTLEAWSASDSEHACGGA